jgi:hypothetical protein
MSGTPTEVVIWYLVGRRRRRQVCGRTQHRGGRLIADLRRRRTGTEAPSTGQQNQAFSESIETLEHAD